MSLENVISSLQPRLVLGGENIMVNSNAITKIQTIVLMSVIIVAAVGGGAAYVMLGGEEQTSETIKIGVLADLDGAGGKHVWQGAKLAAEQINAEGGILGKQIEVIGEDHDLESGVDLVKVNTALTRLLTYHKVDFVIGNAGGEAGFIVQDVIAEHKKIFLATSGMNDQLTQRVLDDYDKYKYYFQIQWNASGVFQGMTDSLLLMREQTGFNKVGYLAEDLGYAQGIMDGLDYVLPEVYGFDLVYKGTFPLGTVDFSSYFAAAEAAGVEVLLPLIALDGGIPFVKEWYDRQSPMLIYGGVLEGATVPESWEWTEGKCENIITAAFPMIAQYPITSKTIPIREAYISRWKENPKNGATFAFDLLRYILADAIERAGTIDTEEVIESLETTSIETSMASNYVFTSSHCAIMGENMLDPDEDYMLVLLFQWQNGKQLPVYPKKIMEQAGVTLTYPPWAGPWDDQ